MSFFIVYHETPFESGYIVVLLFLAVAGSNGVLDGTCLPDGSCKDLHTTCNRGICKCKQDYFDKNAVCRKYSNCSCD